MSRSDTPRDFDKGFVCFAGIVVLTVLMVSMRSLTSSQALGFLGTEVVLSAAMLRSWIGTYL